MSTHDHFPGIVGNKIIPKPFLLYFLFNMLFAALLLVCTAYAYHTYRVQDLRTEVERLGPDLLGFIEHDAEQQFHVSAENLEDAKKFLYGLGGAKGRDGFSYIWHVDAQRIIWPSGKNWSGHTAIQNIELEQHAVLSERYLTNAGSLVPDPQAFNQHLQIIEVPADQAGVREGRYMTSLMPFKFSRGAGSPAKEGQYIFVVAKSLEAADCDWMLLVGMGMRMLALLSVVAGILLIIISAVRSRK